MCKHHFNKETTKIHGGGLPCLNRHLVLFLPALAIYGIAQPSNALYAIHLPNPSVSNAIPLAAGPPGSSRARPCGAFIFRHNETNGKSSTGAGKRTSG